MLCNPAPAGYRPPRCGDCEFPALYWEPLVSSEKVHYRSPYRPTHSLSLVSEVNRGIFRKFTTDNIMLHNISYCIWFHIASHRGLIWTHQLYLKVQCIISAPLVSSITGIAKWPWLLKKIWELLIQLEHTSIRKLYIHIFSSSLCDEKEFGKVSKIFNVLKEVSSAHRGCIYLIKNTIKSVKLWNIITI